MTFESELIEDFFLLSTRAFTPTSISNLAMWLDGADAASITLDGSNNVSQWSDKSGNGKHATQATTTKRPSYQTAVQNGLNAVRFDGTDDCLQAASLTLSGQFTLILVCKTTTAKPFFIEHSANVTPNQGFYFYGTEPTASGIRRTATGLVTPGVNVNWFGSAAGVAVFRSLSSLVGGLGYSIRKNGVAQSISGTNLNVISSAASVTDTLNIGSRNNGVSPVSDGDYYEIMLYDRPLTDTEVGTLEAYLKAKWGTP